jgi:hypothetical protein
MHKADDLAEQHSTLVVTISGAAFAFAATQLQNPPVAFVVCAFGILVAAEWFLKINRHNEIFQSARDRLVKIENDEMKIDTARPPSKINGFKILKYLSGVFFLGWILFALWVGLAWYFAKPASPPTPPPPPSAAEVFVRATKEMPSLTHITNTEWNLSSMKWNDQSDSYDLVLFPTVQPSRKFAVTYSIPLGRISNYLPQ